MNRVWDQLATRKFSDIIADVNYDQETRRNISRVYTRVIKIKNIIKVINWQGPVVGGFREVRQELARLQGQLVSDRAALVQLLEDLGDEDLGIDPDTPL